MNNESSKKLAILGLIPFSIMVLAFLFGPLITMIIMSFKSTGGGGFSLEQYKEVFTNAFYMQSFKNSISISLISSSISVTICIATAYFITKLSQKTQDMVLNLSNLTNNFAGVPLAFAFIIMLGNSGLFVLLGKKLGIGFLTDFNLYSWTGLILIYIYFQIPLGIMLLYPTLQGIKDEWKHAASLLGATTFEFWKNIGMPIILPGVAGVFSILFANSMGAYASAYALVGSNYNLLTVQIGALISGDIFSRTELASAIAVILSVILIITLLFNDYMMKKIRRDM
ncbi:MAG: ABC transporter permease [Peptostreptococcaceae bacterium]